MYFTFFPDFMSAMHSSMFVFIPDSPFAIRFAYSLLFVVTFFVS